MRRRKMERRRRGKREGRNFDLILRLLVVNEG